MPYTMEEEAVVRGLLRLYLERDSVDQVVRERYRTFQQDLKQGTLCRSDYQWVEMALRFLKSYWWQAHEDQRALENALLKTHLLAEMK